MVAKGTPIPIYAVRKNGSIIYYESISKAAKAENYTAQYICKDKKDNPFRKYKTKHPNNKGTRFVIDKEQAQKLSEQLKHEWEEFYGKPAPTECIKFKPKTKLKFGMLL